MKHGELRHDLCTITFLTDHVVMTLKYHGMIPVGDDRRGTGIIRKTCDEVEYRDDESLCTGIGLKYKSGV